MTGYRDKAQAEIITIGYLREHGERAEGLLESARAERFAWIRI